MVCHRPRGRSDGLGDKLSRGAAAGSQAERDHRESEHHQWQQHDVAGDWRPGPDEQDQEEEEADREIHGADESAGRELALKFGAVPNRTHAWCVAGSISRML